MSVLLDVNGQEFAYPEVNDVEWGAEATDWAVAVTNGMLQKAGGLFLLLAEVDFGASFGLASSYYKSRTANLSSTGTLRLARTDFIGWRNTSNAGDLELGVNASDQLTFNGAVVGNFVTVSDTSTIDLTLAAGDLSAAIIALSIDNALISATAAIAHSKMAALTASRAVVTDGSGFATVSTTTAAQIAFLDTVSSNVQTQIDSKQTISSSLELLEIAVPAAPSTDGFKLFAFDDDGVTYPAFIDATGARFEFLQDCLVEARNTTGSTIAKGTVVYINGSSGLRTTIALAQANAGSTSKALGITAEAITNNTQGRVMKLGKLTGLNTSAFAAGDELFLSSTVAGGLVNTQPVHPNLACSLGFVGVAHASNGEIVVITQAPSNTDNGTNKATFTIGTSNAASIILANTSTAQRTVTFPDKSGTVAMTSDLPTSPLPLSAGGSGKALTANAGGIVWTDSDSMEVLAPGSSGQVLTSGGTGTPTWASPLTNPMDSEGDLIVGGAAGAATKLDAGNAGEILQANGAASPSWVKANAYVGTNPEVGGSTPFQMVVANAKNQVINPAGAITIKLPTTGVLAGEVYTIQNRSTNIVTVQSSGANDIYAMNLGVIKLVALQATPTSAAHWELQDVNDQITGTIGVNGVFTSGGVYKIARSGKLCVLEISTAMSFSSASSASTNVAFLPTKFVPAYDVANLTTWNSSIIQLISVATNGQISFSFKDWTGANSAQTSTLASSAISWAV